MKIIKVLFVLLVVCGNTLPAHAQALSHDEELSCLAVMYLRNVFGDEKQKNPTIGGWSVPTPGEAVSPFEPGEYLAKLNRIHAAADAGNMYAAHVLGEMYGSGTCVPENEDLARGYFDKARAYVIVSGMMLVMAGQTGKPKESIKEAYWFLQIGLLRYPYVDEEDAKLYFAHRGKNNPADWEVNGFISERQPPKEELEKRMSHLVELAQTIKEPFTRDEIKALDKRARDWVERHP